MVGTAVSQVGTRSSSQAKTRSALKPGVQTTVLPARSEAITPCHQPVDVEERHDVEAAIAGLQREPAGDIGGRRAEVGAGQRHDLGP